MANAKQESGENPPSVISYADEKDRLSLTLRYDSPAMADLTALEREGLEKMLGGFAEIISGIIAETPVLAMIGLTRPQALGIVTRKLLEAQQIIEEAAERGAGELN